MQKHLIDVLNGNGNELEEEGNFWISPDRIWIEQPRSEIKFKVEELNTPGLFFTAVG